MPVRHRIEQTLATLLTLAVLACAAVPAQAAVAVAGGSIIPVSAPGAGYVNDNNHPFPFMLFLPSGYSPTGPACPLVISLHGNGEVGDGSSDGTLTSSAGNQLAYLFNNGPLRLIKNGSTYFGDHGAIVVGMQSDLANGSAFNANRIDLTIRLLLASYHIDPNRIYTMGLSAGAGGLIRFAYDYANNPNYRLAVIVPIANIQGLGTGYTDFTKFTGSITWFINDSDDGVAPLILSTGRIWNGYGDGWAGGISRYLDQAASGGAVPVTSAKARCLDTHPDLAAISAGGFNTNGTLPGGQLSGTYTARYDTTNVDGWTWVANQTFTAGSRVQLTVRQGGGHSGWNETFGSSTPNLPYWNWIMAQRLGQTPTGFAGGSPSVSLSPGNVTVTASQTRQFTATALDLDGSVLAPQPTITWTCGSGGSISSSGLFTATAISGTVIVSASATVASSVYTSTATVTLAAPTIVVTPSSATVTASQTQQFTAIAKGQGGVALSPQPTITWTCGSGGSINAGSGLFTATGGSGTVTVAASAIVASTACIGTVPVTLAAPTIVVTPGTASVVASTTQQFTAIAKGPGGVALNPQPTFTWSSGSGGSVDAASGLFTATAGSGTATVTASATIGSSVYTAHGSASLVAPTIVLTPTNATVIAPQTQLFTANATEPNGTPLPVQPPFAWSVVGSGGTIDAAGLFTASASSGTVTVKAAVTIGGSTYVKSTTVALDLSSSGSASSGGGGGGGGGGCGLGSGAAGMMALLLIGLRRRR